MKKIEEMILKRLSASEITTKELYWTTFTAVSENFTVNGTIIPFTDFQININNRVLYIQYKDFKSTLIANEISVRFY